MKYPVKEELTILEFLQKINQGWSKAKIKSLISYHAILVDNRMIKRLDTVVKNGQVVEIRDTKKVPQDKRLKILYEDHDFIAVDKPAGILSVSDATKEETMYQIVSRYVKTQNRHAKIFVLHRLDKETSGVLVFAKDEKLKYRMQDKWNELVTCREYVAIVEGRVQKEKGTISTYLNETSSYRVYSTKNKEEGKLAITHYKKIKEEKGYTWLQVSLDTGRKNQIRVHMNELHTAIAGDKKYGAKTNPFKRLGLHASKLIFTHPVTNKQMILEAPLPNVLKKI